MIKSLKVFLWNEEIGCLSWDERRRTSYFTYNATFINRGLNVAPIVSPVSNVRALLPIWGEEAKIYQKLPAFLADSLPDAWGNQLFDLWRIQNHLSNSDITPLDKLSFIGKRGMGALEFIPELHREKRLGKIDMKSLADLAERIFVERENAQILPEESITMQSLLTVGTSAGGRQPKAIIAINPETGEIRSGQIAGQEGFEYYLLKFGNSKYSSAELEQTYYEMAIASGISMMPSRLYQVEGNNHFLTKRFDRDNDNKLHTQTLAAICPGADSYEQLLSVCRRLHLPESDCQEVFRRMIFNVLANNTDDHNKNFSFIMSQDGKWRLSPAYDITYVINEGGFQPNEDHCMYLRAKLRDIMREDVILFARDNGIRRPDSIIRDVVGSLKKFREIATKNCVSNEWIGRVETTIHRHLIELGEEPEDTATTMILDGHDVSNIYIEQTYRGNYHLYATVDSKKRKFIIGKNKDEHAVITKCGIANLTKQQLIAMLKEYLLH